MKKILLLCLGFILFSCETEDIIVCQDEFGNTINCPNSNTNPVDPGDPIERSLTIKGDPYYDALNRAIVMDLSLKEKNLNPVSMSVTLYDSNGVILDSYIPLYEQGASGIWKKPDMFYPIIRDFIGGDITIKAYYRVQLNSGTWEFIEQLTISVN